MHEKIPDVHIMQKNLNTPLNVPIAEASVSHTEYVLPADSMTVASLSLQKHRIGVDLMGCEASPEEVLSLLTRECSNASYSLRFFGLNDTFKDFTPANGVSYTVAEEVISMGEDPMAALKKRTKSSLALGIFALKNQEIDAFISAGNTGALLAFSKMHLKTIPGILRPALLTLLPTKTGDMAVLDVGANTSFRTKHLIQFAAMGIAYQKTRGIENPKVGLLNIGEEALKGTPELRETYQKLKEFYPNSFLGNLEARDVFEGKAHVLVTDGFTGNIFLKTAEGIAGILLELLPAGCIDPNFLIELKKQLHYAEYPGALFCGLQGVVMKCHGSAKPKSFLHSVEEAKNLLQNKFLENISHQLKFAL